MTPPTATEPKNAGALSLNLRPAERGDSDRLFEWVNRPDSLVAKLRTTAPIPRADHDRWFAARLAAEDCLIWIAEVDGAAVGQVRCERRGNAFEVDIYLEAAQRRRGLALRMLEVAVARVRAEYQDARLIARVRTGNVASRRLFQRAGFQTSAGAAAAAGDHLVFSQEPMTGEGK
jgi:RimJ/RimL family protein N-acetyltransferase